MGYLASHPHPIQFPFWFLNALIKGFAAEKTSQEATIFRGSNGIHWKWRAVL